MTRGSALRGAALAAALAASVGLSSCGGGGGSDSSATSTHQGSLAVSLSGGVSTGFDHVWVTVGTVALNTDPDKPWVPGDTSWQVIHLDTPVTVDLAALQISGIAPIVLGNLLPAATYGQMRLLLVEADADLTSSAKTANLTYNDQVDYTDAQGIAQHVPLETSPLASVGLRVPGPIVLAENDALAVTVEWDLAHNLVPVASPAGVDHFLLRPDLRPLELSNTAAVVGVMDKALFCPAGAPASNCLHDVVATALMPTADGRYEHAVRSAPVQVGTTYATFALYPLPGGATIDVVIHGRNMQTMVVRNVPALPTPLLQAIPTQLGANPADPASPVPIEPVLRPEGDAQVALGTPMAERSTQLVFAQTLPGTGSLPLEVTLANVDPFTGLLAQPLALPSGPMSVAQYSADTVLSFQTVSPVEGDNQFSVISVGTRYENASPAQLLAAPGGTLTSFTAPEPVPMAGLSTAPLTVTLGGGTASRYDTAMLVVSDVGGVVATQDVSTLVGKGGTVTLQLPAGSAAAALGGTAVYAVAVREWKQSSAATVPAWGRASQPVDLRSASSGSASVTLP